MRSVNKVQRKDASHWRWITIDRIEQCLENQVRVSEIGSAWINRKRDRRGADPQPPNNLTGKAYDGLLYAG